jgi:hypothetical protein
VNFEKKFLVGKVSSLIKLTNVVSSVHQEFTRSYRTLIQGYDAPKKSLSAFTFRIIKGERRHRAGGGGGEGREGERKGVRAIPPESFKKAFSSISEFFQVAIHFVAFEGGHQEWVSP